MNEFRHPTRRRFLQLGAGALLARGLPAFGAADGEGEGLETVALIHTTDLHGNILPTSDYGGTGDLGGIARCATRIGEWREAFPRNLVVDLGDLYQGTEVGLMTRGKVMTDTVNHLDYQAWLIGNHEFDWGAETMAEAVGRSEMPVLSANAEFDGRRTWKPDDRGESIFAPYLIHETGGYRIAVIGMTTPGMPNWFLPEILGGFRAHDPTPVFEALLREVEDREPDAIVLATHMGGRPGYFGDDEANRLSALARSARRADGRPRIDAIIGGHTHQHLPQEAVHGIPYSQAAYFGIALGRLDLGFDPESRRLVRVAPTTERMDSAVALDPAVIALTRDAVEEAETRLDEPAGALAEDLSHRRPQDGATDIERLIASSIHEGLETRGIAVDGVIHGMLYTREPWTAGEKTIREVWEIIPFENFIVTGHLTLEALKAVAAEARGSNRSLVGLRAEFSGSGNDRRCEAIFDGDGRPLEASRRFAIAVNSYDAAGGGGHLPTLRRVLDEPASRRKMHRLQSRALLVDYLTKHRPLSRDDLMS